LRVCVGVVAMHGRCSFVSQSPWDVVPVLGNIYLHSGGVRRSRRGDRHRRRGFATKGGPSVAVTRQYSGTWGRSGSSQVAVSLKYANRETDNPLALQVDLPEGWAQNRSAGEGSSRGAPTRQRSLNLFRRRERQSGSIARRASRPSVRRDSCSLHLAGSLAGHASPADYVAKGHAERR